MSTHYRKNLYFNILELEKYKICINKLYLCLDNLNLNISMNKKDFSSFKEFDDLFYNFMNDDFNIPKVYTLIFDMMHEINKFKYNNRYLLASKLACKMKYFSNLIGILNNNVSFYLRNNDNKFIKKINRLIEVRNLARKKKK